MAELRKMVRHATVKQTRQASTKTLKSTSLEFADCWLDPPRFRRALGVYERELEGTHKQLKTLIKHIDDMVAKGRDFAAAQDKVNESIRAGFNIGNIGISTVEERDLKESLECFAKNLDVFNNCYTTILDKVSTSIKTKLEEFDSEKCKKKFKDQKKAFHKASEKYYSSMNNSLQVSERKNVDKIKEADESSDSYRKDFHRQSLKYVDTLLTVEEEKKYQIPEHIHLYTKIWTNAFESTVDEIERFKVDNERIQKQLNNAREKHRSNEKQMNQLKLRHEKTPLDMMQIPGECCHEGHVLLMEKGLGGSSRLQNVKGIGNKWVHRYLSISDDKKQLTLSVTDDADKLHKDVKYSIIKENQVDSPLVTTDRRFTFDLMALEAKSQEKRSLTIQAADYNEFTQWKARLGPNMSGNARVFKTGTPGQLGHLTMNLTISDHIIERITTAVAYIEGNNGLATEGIYRLTGVQSKVDDLISIMINEHTDPIDWDAYDLRTMTSAVKGLFRNFKEPLMTFELHESFLDCVKNQSMSIDSRVDNLRHLVQSLPKENQVLLSHIAQHLVKIAAREKENKMNASNLSVCFGPVFMWKEEESCEAIFDVRHQCSVVQLLIESSDQIFMEETNEETKEKAIALRENSFSLSNRTKSRSSLNHSITNATNTTTTTSSARSSKCQSQYDNFTCDPINEQSDGTSSSTEQLATTPTLASSSTTSTSTSNVNLGAIPESSSRNKDNSSSSERSEDPDSDSHNHHHNHPVHIEKTKLKNRPSTLVRRQTGVEPSHQPTPRDSVKTVKARAIFPCTADQDDELSFEKGQLFVDVKSYNENDGWYYATMELNGRSNKGLVPGPFIEFVD